MITTLLSLSLGALSFCFTVLVFIGNNSKRNSERVTRLESFTSMLNDVPTRLAKVESLSEHSHNRLNSLEEELKTEIRELKTMLMQIVSKLGA